VHATTAPDSRGNATEARGDEERRVASRRLSSRRARGCARVRDPFADRCVCTQIPFARSSLGSRWPCCFWGGRLYVLVKGASAALRPPHTSSPDNASCACDTFSLLTRVDPPRRRRAPTFYAYSAGFMKRESTEGGFFVTLRATRIPRPRPTKTECAAGEAPDQEHLFVFIAQLFATSLWR
jgi:hypothetical protein